MKRALAIVGLCLACTVGANVGSASWLATGSGSGGAKAKPDWVAPAVTAATIAQVAASSPAGFVRPGASYRVYAEAADSGNPASGIAGVTADVSSITTGAAAVPLAPCTSDCTVDGATYAYRSAPQTADAPLAEGNRSYSVRAFDSAGNAAAQGGFAVAVDNTPPTTEAGVSPFANASGWNNTSVDVSLSATDASSGVASITYGATGATAVATTTVPGSSVSLAVATEGITTVSFGATDHVGNAEATKTQTVKVDMTAPSAGGSTIANTATGSAGVVKQGGGYVVYANGSDSLSGVATVRADLSSLTAGASAVALSPCASACTVDGAAYAYKSAVQTADAPLAEGVKSYSLTVTDDAGNVATQGGFGATVDNTAPAPTLASPTDGSATNDQTPTFSGAAGTASGDLATITITIHSGSSTAGSVVTTVTATASGASWTATPGTNLPEGTYTAQAQQLDTAGNTGSSAPSTFTVDVTPPSAPASVSLANGGGQGNAYINAANKSSLTISVALPATSLATDTLRITLSDGSGSVTATATATAGAGTATMTGVDASALADGTITLRASSTDRAGNTSSEATSTRAKDTVGPSAPTATYVDNKQPAADVITGTAEGGSTVSATQTAPSSSGPYTTTAAANGAYTVPVAASPKKTTVTYVVTATDAAGNAGAATTLTTTTTQ